MVQELVLLLLELEVSGVKGWWKGVTMSRSWIHQFFVTYTKSGKLQREREREREARGFFQKETKIVEKKGGGTKAKIRRLRSWVFSAPFFLGGELSLSRFLFDVALFPYYVMMAFEKKSKKEKKRKMMMMSWVSAVNCS